jgi:adenylate kinase
MEVDPLKIVLLGTPGGGKGTQAKLICEYLKIPHVSTGDIFRDKIKEGSKQGKEINEYTKQGKLVPDSMTISFVEDRIKRDDCRKGFLLDGFPRNENQAKALDVILKNDNNHIDLVFLIDVPEEVILDRILGRRVCPKCGESYHLKYNPPKISGKCNVCGTELIHRSDDKEDIVVNRLRIYNLETKPIVDFYHEKGILYRINGAGEIHEIFAQIKKIFDQT